MDLQIEQRERDGIVILDLEGRLVLGGEDVSLLQRLLFLLERTHHRVIVNLKRISDIDTSGFDALVFSAMRFQECGGRPVLLRVGQSDANLPDLVNVNAVPETYQEEADAVDSFFEERGTPYYDILEFVQNENRLIERNVEMDAREQKLLTLYENFPVKINDVRPMQPVE
jgi:anti-sigma B factor antagonist